MFKPSLIVAIAICCSLWIISCNSSPKENPLLKSSTLLPDSSSFSGIRYRDQQHIEKVLLSFCEYFDNGALDKCMEYMDDSIHGEIDGVKLRGKRNWSAKINELQESVKSTHYQTRHLITNMQFFPAADDTVKVSMYSACLWTDLTTGQIQLMSVGYYKGKVVRKDSKWYIALLNSLPDSRLVKQFYQDVKEDSVKVK
jgi:hypothetical protein